MRVQPSRLDLVGTLLLTHPGALMNRIALLTLAALVAMPATAFAQTPAPSGAMHSAMKHDAMAHGSTSHGTMTHGAMANPKKGAAMTHGAMSHDAMSHSMTHASPKP
jgi:pentapeptide MXKDX repeat protein